MPRPSYLLPSLLFMAAVVSPVVASAGQEKTSQGAFSADQEPQASAETRKMCKREVQKVCKFIIPSKSSIRHCIDKNRDTLPQQCVALFDSKTK